MKIYIFILITIFFSCYSCGEEGILQNSNDTSYLYFSNSVQEDSITMSFFFYPGDVVKIPVEVCLSGRMLEEDTPFRLSVDRNQTTVPDGNYDVSEPFVFHSGHLKDTIHITLINTPKISTGKYRLVLKIDESDALKLGAIPYQRAKILMSNEAAKPDWWKDNVESFLGAYSQKKYKLFMEQTGVSDLTGMNSGQVREYALVLKQYVEDWETEHGEIMMDEENGERMTIPVIG